MTSNINTPPTAHLNGALPPPTRSTIIFINDALTSPNIWDPLLPSLENDYHIIKFDIFHTPTSPTLQTLTTSLRKTLSSARLTSPKIHIIALGIGAALSLHVLSSPPNFSRPGLSPRVASFAGISLTLATSPAHAASLAATWAERGEGARESGMRGIAEEAVAKWMEGSRVARGSTAWNSVRACVVDIPESSFSGIVHGVVEKLYEGGTGSSCSAGVGMLGRVRVPCLFVAGGRDEVQRSEIEGYAKGVRGAESGFWVVEGAGRVPWWEDEEGGKGRFVMGLRKWIQQVEEGR